MNMVQLHNYLDFGKNPVARDVLAMILMHL
jgi:hypothetical protein